MKTARISDGRQQGLLTAVLAIAQDRATDRRAMDAQLMGASGTRPKRQESGTLAGAIEHTEVGQGLLPLVMIDLHRFAIARARPLGQRQIDRALGARRCADNDRPIELLGLAVAERLGKPLRR